MGLGRVREKGRLQGHLVDDEPYPAHLVHCVASLQALMFLQYTLFASPGFSDSSLAVLSVYIQPFTVNLYGNSCAL